MKDRLRILRKYLCMTQAEFGDKINVKANTIGSYEKGDRSITERAISDIVRVYGCSEQWFRTGEGEMFPVPSDSSGEEFSKYAEQLLNSNSAVDQWTKELVVRWCKLTPERQKIVILTLHDLFGNDDDQKKLEELFPFI